MSTRKTPLVTGEIYHVFNRSVAQLPIFNNRWEYRRMLGLIDYYRFVDNPVRYSHFARLDASGRVEFINNLRKVENVRVELYSFAIMPNHYHLLVRQMVDNGISKYISDLQNSYARYINVKNSRFGALFQSPFKAVRIENEYQLIHVSRYIHLNPLTSYVLKNPEELKVYSWNSFMDYFSDDPRPLLNTDVLNGLIKKDRLVDFTFNQLNYQRALEEIKHLVFDA